MEYLPNGYTLEVPEGCFPLSTDSILLGHFAAITGARRVLDLGSGCGTLGLLLCAQAPCRVVGYERDETAHRAALANIERNALTGRMDSICQDLRQIPALCAPGQFDCAVSNPPYFPGGPAAELREARREDTCPLEELLRAAAWSLKYGGDLYLVHRPERLGQIIALGAAQKLEAKRLCTVHHRQGGPVSLILVQLRKGGKPGLAWEDITLHNADGTKTAVWNEIYHIREE